MFEAGYGVPTLNAIDPVYVDVQIFYVSFFTLGGSKQFCHVDYPLSSFLVLFGHEEGMRI